MSSNQEIPPLPEKFRSTIVDFATDLTTTFPEFSYLWAKWSNPATTDFDFQQLFLHCLNAFPERFFDILNQNAEIFNPENTTNTVFLPNVEFKMLYHCSGTSDATRQTLWKYLQVILFMLIGSVKDKMDFGEAMGMFDGLDEGDLQSKLKETMASIGDFFGKATESGAGSGSGSANETETDHKNAFEEAFSFINKMGEETSEPTEEAANAGTGSRSGTGLGSGTGTAGLPKPEDLHDHLKNLFDGKIGKLAKELADDLGQDLADTFGDDIQNAKSTKDVFAKLMQNPQKISGLVKTVGEKLNKKMESGEISREDIMGEAGELMRKMKDMGGAGQFADMFKTMAKGMGVNIPKGAKIDANALSQMEKKMTTADKMRARMQTKKQQQLAEQMAAEAKIKKQHEDYQKFVASQSKFSISGTEDPHNFVFRLDDNDKQEKTPIQQTSTKPALSVCQKKNLKKKLKKQTNQNANTTSADTTSADTTAEDITAAL